MFKKNLELIFFYLIKSQILTSVFPKIPAIIFNYFIIKNQMMKSCLYQSKNNLGYFSINNLTLEIKALHI